MRKSILRGKFAAAVMLSAAQITAFAEDNAAGKGIVILHMNDAHCGINADDETFGYADIAAYEAKLRYEGCTTLPVDAGDYVQGDVIGTFSDGEYIIDIMNELGFVGITTHETAVKSDPSNFRTCSQRRFSSK